MDSNNLLKDVEISDIPEAYHPIVSLIGLDNFLKMCEYSMGDEIYFPMRETIFRKARNRLIIQEYNGYNHAELAKKYNLTSKQIKNIVNAQY